MIKIKYYVGEKVWTPEVKEVTIVEYKDLWYDCCDSGKTKPGYLVKWIEARKIYKKWVRDEARQAEYFEKDLYEGPYYPILNRIKKLEGEVQGKYKEMSNLHNLFEKYYPPEGTSGFDDLSVSVGYVFDKQEPEIDDISKKVLAYLLIKKEAPFNQICEDIAGKEKTEGDRNNVRRYIFGRLLRMNDADILISDMKELEPYGENGHIKHWLKYYRIAGKYTDWAKKITKNG